MYTQLKKAKKFMGSSQTPLDLVHYLVVAFNTFLDRFSAFEDCGSAPALAYLKEYISQVTDLTFSSTTFILSKT